MIRLRLAALFLVVLVPSMAAAFVDEATLLQLTADFDRALTSRDAAHVAPFLHENYTYTGPELPPAASVGLSAAARRVALGGCSSSQLSVRLAGPTAVVTGTYTANENVASPRFLNRGRFTATWVRTDSTWQLLAEHRSLNDVLEWAPSTTAQKTPAPAPNAAPLAPAPVIFSSTDNSKKSGRDETHARHGHLPREITRLFRAYEATQIGYTQDQGDDAFMDFKFSAMFPFHPGAANYPDPVRRSTDEPFFRPTGYSGPNVYFAATLRAGQYIGTRPSSPVVGKRFNPLVAVRFWATEKDSARRESEDNFLEFSYGHESNGQFIASGGRFNDQLRVYLNQSLDAPTPDAATLARSTAYRSTRDNISRGWDYLGFQFARDWDTNLFDSWAPDATIGLRAKFNYYLPKGLLQGDSEEFNKSWETTPIGVFPDSEGKARKYVDGLSFRYALTVAPPRGDTPLTGFARILRFERRYTLTYTTGYVDPFRFNTVKAEAGINLYGLPLMLWYRYGYNSDLIDYYRRDHSFGVTLSFWNF